MYPSPLRAELPEPRLRWMLLVSLVLHAALLAAFFGTPPDTSKKIYYSPVYSVSLVDAPPGPPGPSGDKAGAAQQQTRLWKGPPALETETKAAKPRSHNIITVSKSEEFEYAPSAKPKKRPDEGPQQPATRAEGKAAASSGEAAENISSAGAGSASSGGSGGGGGGGTADLKFSRYYQAIWERIQQAWVLPPLERKGALEAIVVITVQRDGRILGFEFEKKSGDENLDNSVVRAIKKADPLPPFPPDMRESVLEVGIRFIPEDKM
ncbi:MAG: TonB C-terminal domain-containing protein [Desulfobacterota bacterium]|nr:TonB C-terminal domain-containing protein [Thermodesulfobacteriota bacterium]